LNGYKINNPTILARIQEEELLSLMWGYGWTPYMVAGHDLESMHHAMAATMETCVKEILRYQKEARSSGKAFRPRWPMIILRSPKGWTAPRKDDDGKFLEGYWRAHQVPLTKVATDSEQLKMLERWMHSYEPGKLFGIEGKLIPELRELAPSKGKRMSENPITNGGILRRPLKMRHFQDFSLHVDKPGVTTGPSMSVFADFLREIVKDNQQTFRVFGPDETESNKLGKIYEVGKKVWVNGYLPEDEDGGNLAPEGRVMEMLSEHTVEGWLEGYILSGRHGMLNSYESFVHIIDSMVNQHAKWMEKCTEVSWRRAVSSLNILLTSTVWRQGKSRVHACRYELFQSAHHVTDHNGFTHQDPGFLDVVVNKSPAVVRIYLPPDANCLLSTMSHCFNSTNYVNVIVADKQVHLQYLNMEAAIAHCTKGIGIWDWASNDSGAEPDVVLTSCGDVMTQEALAATALLRELLPGLKVRFVNVVDLFKLIPHGYHPHGLTDKEYTSLFTNDRPIIFAFHSYPWLVHRLTYNRPGQERMHVRGYKEKGNINTPLELAIRNEADRFSLAILALDNMSGSLGNRGAGAREKLVNERIRVKDYALETGLDLQQFTDWTWPF
jgi:xylulose-5-phosphate/fructose-6-phosphate phosphoketolase